MRSCIHTTAKVPVSSIKRFFSCIRFDLPDWMYHAYLSAKVSKRVAAFARPVSSRLSAGVNLKAFRLRLTATSAKRKTHIEAAEPGAPKSLEL